MEPQQGQLLLHWTLLNLCNSNALNFFMLLVDVVCLNDRFMLSCSTLALVLLHLRDK